MFVLTAPRTLQVDLKRRGKGREGRKKNMEKSKRMRKRREEWNDERGEETRQSGLRTEEQSE